jgi:hypothetical protein
MADELSELRENAEHGKEDKSLAPVTVTMAIFAVLVAVVSLLGHRSHTEEILLMTKSVDQWAYYQAKNIRERSYEVFVDQLSVFSIGDQARAKDLKEKYQSEIDRYKKEMGDIMTEARAAEAEQKMYEQRANRFDLGEALLEAALVICSITLLTRKRSFWLIGLAGGFVGIAIALSAFLIHMQTMAGG